MAQVARYINAEEWARYGSAETADWPGKLLYVEQRVDGYYRVFESDGMKIATKWPLLGKETVEEWVAKGRWLEYFAEEGS